MIQAKYFKKLPIVYIFIDKLQLYGIAGGMRPVLCITLSKLKMDLY